MSHPRFLVADLHCDTVLELHGGASLGGNAPGHVDIPRMRRGGVGLQVFACFVPSGFAGGRAYADVNRLLDTLSSACERHAADVQMVGDAAGCRVVMDAGRIAVLPAIENGEALAGDLRNLEHFRHRGVRTLTLTHARHLPWAASSGEPWAGERGLTPFGEDIVREMNRLGMIVDVSHVHERTFWDVVRVARRPFIASHSCAAALCPVARNLTDDQLRAVAAGGGMIGVNFFPAFLDPAYLPSLGSSLPQMFREMEAAELEFADDPPGRLEAVRALSASMRERAGEPIASIDTVVDHVEYIARLVGDDYVGFGSDFDGVTQLPRGLADCTAFPAILDRLAARGFGESSLRKIACGNFLRVLEAS